MLLTENMKNLEIELKNYFPQFDLWHLKKKLINIFRNAINRAKVGKVDFMFSRIYLMISRLIWLVEMLQENR
jgi:hypothetical protein